MKRWTRDAWLEHGERQLKAEGAQGLTLERLCLSAGRTRGSFYHHFASTDAFVAALLDRWRARDTDGIGEATLAAADPVERRRVLRRLTAEIDHTLEMAVRRLAETDPRHARRVEEADARREAVLAELLEREFAVGAQRARDAARLIHSIQLAAEMRAPEDVRGFARPLHALVFGWLERDLNER